MKGQVAFEAWNEVVPKLVETWKDPMNADLVPFAEAPEWLRKAWAAVEDAVIQSRMAYAREQVRAGLEKDLEPMVREALQVGVPPKGGIPTIAVDFDGVIHSYTSGWKGATVIPDPPTDSQVIRRLHEYCDHFNVCISSARSKEPGGIEAMRDWFDRWESKHDWELLDAEALRATHRMPLSKRLWFPIVKPSAFVTIDDRAIQFTGVLPSVGEIEGFKTWQQQQPQQS
jgi:hypothetical protein